jgi:hypothetical protein
LIVDWSFSPAVVERNLNYENTAVVAVATKQTDADPDLEETAGYVCNCCK